MTSLFLRSYIHTSLCVRACVRVRVRVCNTQGTFMLLIGLPPLQTSLGSGGLLQQTTARRRVRPTLSTRGLAFRASKARVFNIFKKAIRTLFISHIIVKADCARAPI